MGKFWINGKSAFVCGLALRDVKVWVVVWKGEGVEVGISLGRWTMKIEGRRYATQQAK